MPRKNTKVSKKDVQDVLNLSEEELAKMAENIKPTSTCYTQMIINKKIETRFMFECKTESIKIVLPREMKIYNNFIASFPPTTPFHFNVQVKTEYGTVISLDLKETTTNEFQSLMLDTSKKLSLKLADEFSAPEITKDVLDEMRDTPNNDNNSPTDTITTTL